MKTTRWILQTYGRALRLEWLSVRTAISGMYRKTGRWLGLLPPNGPTSRLVDATITSSEARSIVWPADQWAEIREDPDRVQEKSVRKMRRSQRDRNRPWMAPRNGGYMHED